MCTGTVKMSNVVSLYVTTKRERERDGEVGREGEREIERYREKRKGIILTSTSSLINKCVTLVN